MDRCAGRPRGVPRPAAGGAALTWLGPACLHREGPPVRAQSTPAKLRCLTQQPRGPGLFPGPSRCQTVLRDGCLAPHEATPSPGQEVLAQHRPGLGPWELPRAFLTALLPLLGQLTGPPRCPQRWGGGGVLSLPSLRHPSCCLPLGDQDPTPCSPQGPRTVPPPVKTGPPTGTPACFPRGRGSLRQPPVCPVTSPLRASGLRHPFMKISSPWGAGPGDRLHPVWAKTSRVREGFPQARASRWGGSTAQGGSVHTQPGWRGGKAANEGLQGHVDRPPQAPGCAGATHKGRTAGVLSTQRGAAAVPKAGEQAGCSRGRPGRRSRGLRPAGSGWGGGGAWASV